MTFQPLPEVTEDTALSGPGEPTVCCASIAADDAERVHPPTPVCPECLATDVGPEAAPDMEVPCVVAVDDVPDVQLTTRLVDVEPDAVSVDMPVEVTLLQVDDIALPLFRPTSTGVDG